MVSLSNAKAQAHYEARAKIVKAMAHPTRLFLMDELSRGGQRCVQELTDLIGVSMSTVSRHLAMLQNAGLIEHDKRGSQVYYRIRIGCVLSFFDCVESVLGRNSRDRRKRTAS